ncbi:unnamed protein product [Pieris macdunnoughi]|uniref:Mutator-like transposase domain-containing protein n=1 Tax=Pieris macdunnoughi TaxID=345717 RepID=A0A821X190_9NEOP|nr:unnamed protein product [Pieris macdunnoughi]
MKFAVPRIWREPTDHIHDCYFCVVNPSKRRAGKNAKKIEYPNLPSTSAPVPHSENFPVPSNPKRKAEEQLPLSQICSNSGDSEFVITSPSVEPHLINSEEFDDLVRDLNLPKLKAEILASRLKQWNLLKSDVKISDQRTRHKTFSGFFTKEDGLCYCNDVKGLPTIGYHFKMFLLHIIKHRTMLMMNMRSCHMTNTIKILITVYHEEQENINVTPLLEGNRVVDIAYLFSQLTTMSHHPFDCNFTSMDFIKEKGWGSCQVFIFAVEGVFQTGSGYAKLDEICACLNMPNMSERYYMKICSKLGDIHRDVDLQHMLEAGKEEKQLAIDQGDIVTDGIPYNHNNRRILGSKRSYGTNFNSLSSVGCIIGLRTKKILFIGVRNSYCCICAVAAKRKPEVPAHKCYKNWFGSSTQMETDAIVEGFKISVSMHGL